MLFQYLQSEEFTAFANVFGIIGDLALLFLTLYTLHKTALSKKLDFVSPSFSTSIFQGEQIAVTIMNKSLHTIPIQEIFVLKRKRGKNRKRNPGYLYLKIADYENPLSIGGWDVKRFEMDRFTEIHNMINNKGVSGYDDLFQDAVLGVKAGKKLIWIKPYRKASLSAAKRAYKKGDYQVLSVVRRIYEGQTVSKSVDCLIYLQMKGINGLTVLHRVFGITGFNNGKSVCLSEPICGYNALPCPGHTAEEIENTIHECFGIERKRIRVELIGSDSILQSEEE